MISLFRVKPSNVNRAVIMPARAQLHEVQATITAGAVALPERNGMDRPKERRRLGRVEPRAPRAG